LPKYHKGIPADGFPMFAKTIWAKIMENKDLDLPTQQQLLAQFRCDEIAKIAFEKLVNELKHFKPTLETSQVVPAFGKSIKLALKNALEAFDKDGSRYHHGTFLEKRSEFESRIMAHLQVYYLQQLRNLHKSHVFNFQVRLKERIYDEVDFAIKLDKERSETINSFTNQASEDKLEGSDWSYDEYLQLLIKDVDDLCAQKRAEALARVSKLIQVNEY
jgi:hypothetical protein